jgi:hypothetical protein
MDRWVDTNVSEEHTDYIFMAKNVEYEEVLKNDKFKEAVPEIQTCVIGS